MSVCVNTYRRAEPRPAFVLPLPPGAAPNLGTYGTSDDGKHYGEVGGPIRQQGDERLIESQILD